MEVELAARVEALERRLAELEGSRTVQAPLQVVDDEGAMLLRVEAKRGGARLTLGTGSPEEPFITLQAARDGGELAFHYPDRRRLVRLRADEKGGSLGLADGRGGLQVSLGADGEGGGLTLYRTTGEVVLMLKVISGGGYLIALNEREEFVVELANDPYGGGELIVRGPDGKVLFECPAGAGKDDVSRTPAPEWLLQTE